LDGCALPLSYARNLGERVSTVLYRAIEMSIEERESPRRNLHCPAWIDLGGTLPRREGILSDVSDRGARLTIAAANDLPDEFTLLFSTDGNRHRYCRVVWRSDVEVGVEFLGHPGMPPIRRNVFHHWLSVCTLWGG
jgi:hypothetical protein